MVAGIGPAHAQCPPASPEVTLVDASGFTWDIHNDGSIIDGNGAFDYGMKLKVNASFFPNMATFQTELSGRQVVFGPAVISGLDVTRKVFVPAEAPVVIGFDDTYATFLAPPLTTVEQPMHEIGKAAARLAIGTLHEADGPHAAKPVEPSSGIGHREQLALSGALHQAVLELHR